MEKDSVKIFQEMGNHYQENGRLQESQEVHAQVHQGQYHSS